MANLILILGEQLNFDLPALQDCDKRNDEIIMVESMRRAKLKPWHKHKLTQVWGSMRTFGSELVAKGYKVNYITADKTANLKFRDILAVRFHKGRFYQLVATEPNNKTTLAYLKDIGKVIPLELKPSNSFLISAESIKAAPANMDFYEFRKHFKAELPMIKAFQPQGFLKQKSQLAAPKQKLIFSKDAKLVMKQLSTLFPSNAGDHDDFHLPTTTAQARAICERVDNIGGEVWLPMIEVALNSGLVYPSELLKVNSETVGGEMLLQQLIVREYFHYLHLRSISSNTKLNKSLPKSAFGFTPFVEMNCLLEVTSLIAHSGIVSDSDYSSVVQNMMLLMSVRPSEIAEWFNIHTLAPLWESDGRVNYSLDILSLNAANLVNSGTSYCSQCVYSPNASVGERACPVNYLFWSFLIAYREQLQDKPAMQTHYKKISQMPESQQAAITEMAEKFRNTAKAQLTFRQIPAARKH